MAVPENPKDASQEPRSPGLDLPERPEPKTPSITALISQLAENADAINEVTDEVPLQAKLHSLVGKTLDNRYQVLSKIGQGGMGVVYKAKHTILDRYIALKVLNPTLGNDEQNLKRFLREAKTLSKLKHPNAISLYEFGIDEEMPYLVMEFVEGISLNALIQKTGPLPLARTNLIMQQVCEAVQSAHDLGIIHRDLKPDNIMITPRPNGDDWVQVLDFGVAKLMSTSGTTTKLSNTGVPCGTPHYMSPELIMSGEVDVRSDIYALGIILYEMLSGETPFEQDSIVQILFKQVHNAIPLVTESKPELKIPLTVEDIICKAVEKHPSDRYQSVQEFSHALREHSQDKFGSRKSLARKRRMKRRMAAQYQEFRSLRVLNISIQTWTRFWLTILLLTAIIWPAIRWRRELRLFLGTPLLKAEQSLGVRLTPLRYLFRVDEDLSAETVLRISADNDQWRSADMVLGAGANPNVRDAHKRTPLHLSVLHNQVATMELLLKAGADPSAQDDESITPLHIASENNRVSTVYALVQKGANPDAKNRKGMTPMLLAITNGHTGVVHGLIALGASVQMGDTTDRTPLMYTAQGTLPHLVQLLLDKGAAVNARDALQMTALMYAAKAQQKDNVELLIKRGADVNAKNASSMTALMFAVQRRDIPIAQMLMEAGADTSVQNNAGKTAADMARELNVQNLLLEIQRYSKKQ